MTARDPACPACRSRLRMPGGRCAGCAADLHGTCPHCHHATLRLASFCSRCGTALTAAEPDAPARAGAERAMSRRPVSVMFCDLVGSAALAAGMDVEDFSDLLERCHNIVTSIVNAHHGFIARYMGDGTLAFFGYPQSGEDDAQRAVAASLAVLRALPAVTVKGTPMQARIGIATGVVVVGDVVAGSGTRGLDIAGEVPNLAARLQSLAGPGALLVDSATCRLVGDRFDTVSIGAVDLKGWVAPLPAWQVRGALAPAELSQRHVNAKPPFVGRAEELSRLLAAWRSTAAGRGAAVVLVGEMGIGKTRLIAEFLKHVETASRVTRRWYGARYLQGVALHPMVGEIESRAGIVVDDKQPERRRKLELFLAGAPALDRALIIELVAPGLADANIAGLSQNLRREMTLAALSAFIRPPSAATRLLAIFEDYHWADPSSRAWLALTVGGIASLGGLLIVTARPGGEPDWIDAPHVTRIDLDMLAPEDASRIIAQAAGDTTLPAGLVAQILARCDGVPLFLEEVTRAAVDETRAGADADAAPPMPLSIHASLIARLDSLGHERETAQVAAIIGREFRADLLACVTGRSERTIQPALEQMLAAGLVRDAGAGVFRFKHALIQDAAYDSLLRQRRRALHGKVGAMLRDHFPAVAETQPQLLATHFTEAGEAEEAVRWWRAAALRSLQQSAMTEGLAQLDHGLRLLRTLPDSDRRRELELDLLICRGKAHVATTGHASDEVEASLRRASALSRSLPGAPQLLTATFGQWAHYVTRGPLGEAARLSAEISAMAGASGNQVVAMFSDYTAGMTNAMMGEFTIAGGILEKGIAACAALDPAVYLAPATGDPKAVMRSFLAMVETHQGRPAAAARSIALALREARETKLGYSIALALLVKVTNQSFGGAPDMGDGDLNALRDFARSRGMAFFEALECPLRGWVIARRGDTKAGLAMLRDGLEGYRATQSRVWINTFLRMQAEILSWRGQFDEALAMLDEAQAASACVDTAFEDAITARVRGEILARTGHAAAADAAFARAVAAAADSGAHLHAAQAKAAQARLLAAAR